MSPTIAINLPNAAHISDIADLLIVRNANCSLYIRNDADRSVCVLLLSFLVSLFDIKR